MIELKHLLITDVGLSVRHSADLNWLQSGIVIIIIIISPGDLKAETESEIVAAQDQALQTKYYATKILNTETDSKCRLCQHFDETIDHIISAGTKLAKEQHIKRYDSVCVCVHNCTSIYARKQGYN